VKPSDDRPHVNDATQWGSGNGRMPFFFMSASLLDNDYRYPLIQALLAKGHAVYHLRVGRQNILTASASDREQFSGVLGFVRLIAHIRRELKVIDPRVVFIDSAGVFLPLRILALRAAFRGLWCLDIFDNLLYDLRGFRRLMRSCALSLLASLSPIKLVLSAETLRLFPTAHHLDNAAHTHRTERDEAAFRHLVCLFSIDRRFDFNLVAEVAAMAPDLLIYLYGRLAAADTTTRRQFDGLLESHSNIIFRGEYSFEDVDNILRPFAIGFTPYITDDLLTDFINPDKYYLFLNSGMEVISTNVPQARRMQESLHIVRSAREMINLVSRLQNDKAARKNSIPGREYSWQDRADDLVRIVQSYK
jgi:hypothetical protein